VTLLPAAFTVLIIAHIYLIKQLGISPQAAGDATSGPPSSGQGTARFTEHLQKMAGYGFLMLGIVIVLALFAPAPLGNAGLPGAEVTKPPWMFLPIYPLEDVMGVRGILVGAGALFFLLVVVPFVDRSPWLSPRRRKWIIVIGALILVALIISGGYAWFSRPAAHLMENAP
jgi:ubiquinol-cytochrome c reductase cytochrome b subunit